MPGYGLGRNRMLSWPTGTPAARPASRILACCQRGGPPCLPACLPAGDDMPTCWLRVHPPAILCRRRMQRQPRTRSCRRSWRGCSRSARRSGRRCAQPATMLLAACMRHASAAAAPDRLHCGATSPQASCCAPGIPCLLQTRPSHRPSCGSPGPGGCILCLLQTWLSNGPSCGAPGCRWPPWRRSARRCTRRTRH